MTGYLIFIKIFKHLLIYLTKYLDSQWTVDTFSPLNKMLSVDLTATIERFDLTIWFGQHSYFPQDSFTAEQ